jgi:hypothetical protein
MISLSQRLQMVCAGDLARSDAVDDFIEGKEG